MARPKSPLFLKSRLKAIWYLLTRKWFVVVTANSDSRGEAKDISGRYNVNYPSFQLLSGLIGGAIERNEGEAAILNQVEDILKAKP